MRKEKPKRKREFWSNGKLKREEFRNRNGERHNAAGPSFRSWRENGRLSYEAYDLNGKLHNESGPAYCMWDENGQLRRESYWLNGKLHNAAGPAVRRWHENGQLERESYYLNDRQLIYQALLHGVICEGLPAGSE